MSQTVILQRCAPLEPVRIIYYKIIIYTAKICHINDTPASCRLFVGMCTVQPLQNNSPASSRRKHTG